MKLPAAPLPLSVLIHLLSTASPASAHSQLDMFHAENFVSPPETVACTLEDGTETTCYELTVGYKPMDLEIGPFCPATLSDEGGIWDWDGDQAGLYRIDEDFLRMLDDLGYRFFGEDGTVNTVDNATQHPEVDHACINVSEDDSVTIVMLLPTQPVMAAQPSLLGTVGKVGVALDGAPIFSDAPSVLHTGHMPALDTCGGHVDPGGWYHWHATASDIETVFKTEEVVADCAVTQDASALFGFAFDGFPIVGSQELDGSTPADLDACNGHIGQTVHGVSYHYHASEAFPNLPPCLVGETAQLNFITTAQAGVGAPRPGGENGRPNDGQPGGMPPGFEEAAKTLGIDPETLLQTMIQAGGPQADLNEVAQTLGIPAETLKNALPNPPRR